MVEALAGRVKGADSTTPGALVSPRCSEVAAPGILPLPGTCPDGLTRAFEQGSEARRGGRNRSRQSLPVLAALIAVAGCGDSAPALAPVHGTVYHQGTPLPGGIIVLRRMSNVATRAHLSGARSGPTAHTPYTRMVRRELRPAGIASRSHPPIPPDNPLPCHAAMPTRNCPA